MTTVRSPLRRDRYAPHSASSATFIVVASARHSACSRAAVATSISMVASLALSERCTAGRGASSGTLMHGGTPSRCCAHQASCALTRSSLRPCDCHSA